jgi:N utilization substance protein B
MKKASDPRHQRRREAVKALFSWSFKEQEIEDKLAKKIIKHLAKIDKIIEQDAPLWPIKQINRLDLAVLRLAIFELKIEKKEPEKVIIDEAVELAKEFGSESSPGFVNGVLGAVWKAKSKK